MSEQPRRDVLLALVAGGLSVSFLLLLLRYKRTPQRSASQCFLCGEITDAARQEAYQQTQAGPQEKFGPHHETFLHLACRHGDAAAVQELLRLAGPLSHEQLNGHGCNLMHLCAADGDNVEALRVVTEMLKERGGAALLQDTIKQTTFDNQWTCLHLAAAKGHLHCIEHMVHVAQVEGIELPINEKDGGGHTALIMASANGFLECVRTLLSVPECNMYLTNARCKSCLYLSALNKRDDIMRALLDAEQERGPTYTAENSPENRKLVEVCDFSGNSALHAACLRGSVEAARLLLERGGRVAMKSISGDSPMHVLCQRNDADHWEVLQFLRDWDTSSEYLDQLKRLMSAPSSFGCNPLHDGTFCGNQRALEILYEVDADHFMECLKGIDNDGLSPMLTLCRGIVTNKAKRFKPDDLIATLRFVLEKGGNVNGEDFAKSTCLHFLCYSPPNEEIVLEAVKILLAAGADPSIEDTFGWSPVHAIAQTGKEGEIAQQIFDLLMAHLRQHKPDYLATFDKNKVRNITDRTFIDKAGPHNQIPLAERQALLKGDLTIEGIAKYVEEKQKASSAPLKVVVLVGAGISVNCGIPDFRSPESGIYSKINPGQFSGEFLASQPQEFYALVRNLFGGVKDGSVVPGKTHRFLKTLHDKGLLHRVYTQNIDLLEKQAGVPDELIVEAHGSFGSARCMACGQAVEDMDRSFWKPIFDAEVPTCTACDQVVRPDVVFFGENLPSRFFALHHEDLRSADLLIVMGTSLVVYPFASLVGMVPLLTPRLLINKKLTGPFTKIGSESNYRDVAYEGDCDEGTAALARSFGWCEQLE